MQTEEIKSFHIIGISVRTINHTEQTIKDIGGLWEKFLTEKILEQIPNKLDNDIYALYTNYEGDHTQPYDTIIGCKVSSLKEIPDGMIGQTFAVGTYNKLTVKGDLTKGLLYTTWLEIWKKDWNRSYTVDFERYGTKAMNPTDAEVEVYVAINT